MVLGSRIRGWPDVISFGGSANERNFFGGRGGKGHEFHAGFHSRDFQRELVTFKERLRGRETNEKTKVINIKKIGRHRHGLGSFIRGF